MTTVRPSNNAFQKRDVVNLVFFEEILVLYRSGSIYVHKHEELLQNNNENKTSTCRDEKFKKNIFFVHVNI